MPRYAGSRKQVVQYPFHAVNMGNNNGTLFASGDGDNAQYRMIRRGSIIGFSGSLNGALTTGTLTFQATIDGSLSPAFSNELHTNQQATHETQNSEKDNFRFTAGQALGVRYTSSDTVNPATTDGAFIVEVLLDDIEY